MAKFLGGDGKGGTRGWGAQYQFSIYWRFISEKAYYSDDFLFYTKCTVVCLNIWHFFIKKNALWKCLKNLINFKCREPTHEDIKFTIETLFLGYMCGIVMCPGGHTQFQFWYTYMLPILI